MENSNFTATFTLDQTPEDVFAAINHGPARPKSVLLTEAWRPKCRRCPYCRSPRNNTEHDSGSLETTRGIVPGRDRPR